MMNQYDRKILDIFNYYNREYTNLPENFQLAELTQKSNNLSDGSEHTRTSKKTAKNIKINNSPRKFVRIHETSVNILPTKKIKKSPLNTPLLNTLPTPTPQTLNKLIEIVSSNKNILTTIDNSFNRAELTKNIIRFLTQQKQEQENINRLNFLQGVTYLDSMLNRLNLCYPYSFLRQGLCFCPQKKNSYFRE